MATHSVQCPNCGAPAAAEAGVSTFVCAYCGTVVRIDAGLPEGSGQDTALLADVARRNQLLAENQALRARIAALQGPPAQPTVAPLYRGSRGCAVLVVAGLAVLGLCLIATAFSANETESTRALAAVIGTLFLTASLAVLLYERRSAQWLDGVLRQNWRARQSSLAQAQQLRQQIAANERRLAELNAAISAEAHRRGK